MPTVVFACKSNSCRSQMAEGWARKWLDDRIIMLDNTLQEFREEMDDVNDHTAQLKLTQNVERHIEILKDTIIASVALDSNSVFVSSHDNAMERPQRKNVKSKAVDAMGMDGVDISSFQPKTIEEIIPFIKNGNEQMDVSGKLSSSLELGDVIIDEINMDDVIKDSSDQEKPVDKLIVLCSCGQDMKYKLARRSKSVEEWNIDPPTSASKSGEGDVAYRRVSLEIKKEVNILMKSLLGNPKF